MTELLTTISPSPTSDGCENYLIKLNLPAGGPKLGDCDKLTDRSEKRKCVEAALNNPAFKETVQTLKRRLHDLGIEHIQDFWIHQCLYVGNVSREQRVAIETFPEVKMVVKDDIVAQLH